MKTDAFVVQQKIEIKTKGPDYVWTVFKLDLLFFLFI
jgi:hypothetical protein